MMRVCVAAAALLVACTEAHILVTCASTSPQQPGTLTFWFATYHPLSTTPVKGTAHIKAPTGHVTSAPFVDVCGLASQLMPVEGATVNTLAKTIADNCMGITETVEGEELKAFFNDSLVTCYDKGDLPNHAVGLSGTQVPHECMDVNEDNTGDYALVPLQTWYAVILKSSLSGSFEIWTEDTGINMYAGGLVSSNENFVSKRKDTDYPCSINSTRSWFMDVSVAQGGHAKCTTSPTVGLDHVVVSSLSQCDGTKYDIPAGIQCNVVCETGYSGVGDLTCVEDPNDPTVATWSSTFLCAKQTCSLPSSGVNTVSLDSRISGVGPPCNTFTNLNSVCHYYCPQGISPGFIKCVEDANKKMVWQSDVGYIGCDFTIEPTQVPPTRAPPTAAPTKPPTTAVPPTRPPTAIPRTAHPTAHPTTHPTAIPTAHPTAHPTAIPRTAHPTAIPTAHPTAHPTAIPTPFPPRQTAAPRTASPPTATPTKAPPTQPPRTAPPTTETPRTETPPSTQAPMITFTLPPVDPITASPGGVIVNPTDAPDVIVNPTATPGGAMNPTATPGGGPNPTATPGGAVNPTATPGGGPNPTDAPGVVVVPDTATPPAPTDPPATEVPKTRVPLQKTYAPPSDAPLTPAPDTLVPGTTTAPKTDVPETALPDTLAPGDTAVPPTDAPRTLPPLTWVPLPVSYSPPSVAPPTTVPKTLVPLKAGEISYSPPTPAPATGVPPTRTPLQPGQTYAPPTGAPPTGVPPTRVPLAVGEYSYAPDTETPTRHEGGAGWKTDAPLEESEDGGGGGMLIIIIVLVIVVLCVVAVAVFFLRKKRKRTTNTKGKVIKKFEWGNEECFDGLEMEDENDKTQGYDYSTLFNEAGIMVCLPPISPFCITDAI